jgi:heme/copper-type cytochrome/quinol oxidase subunit 3
MARSSNGRFGVLMFITSESLFFLMLIITYMVYQGAPASHGEAARLLSVWRTGVFSVCLWASSYTVQRAGAAQRRGSARGLHLWLLGTIVLGLVFLSGQGWEYADLFRRGESLHRDLFGSSFFTLTGFHGLHVLVGLIILTTVLALSATGRIGERGGEALDTVSVYWHFVDGVWVVIFTVVYLWTVL